MLLLKFALGKIQTEPLFVQVSVLTKNSSSIEFPSYPIVNISNWNENLNDFIKNNTS